MPRETTYTDVIRENSGRYREGFGILGLWGALECLGHYERIEKDGDLFSDGEIRIPKMIEVGNEQITKHQKNVEPGRRGGLTKAKNLKPSHSTPPRTPRERTYTDGLGCVENGTISTPLPFYLHFLSYWYAVVLRANGWYNLHKCLPTT